MPAAIRVVLVRHRCHLGASPESHDETFGPPRGFEKVFPALTWRSWAQLGHLRSACLGTAGGASLRLGTLIGTLDLLPRVNSIPCPRIEAYVSAEIFDAISPKVPK